MNLFFQKRDFWHASMWWFTSTYCKHDSPIPSGTFLSWKLRHNKWNLKKLIIKWCISCTLQSEKKYHFSTKRKKVQNSNISNQIQSLTRPKIFQKYANLPTNPSFLESKKKGDESAEFRPLTKKPTSWCYLLKMNRPWKCAVWI